jgi:glycosyltransferase involved in cell wall biosynthesis
MIDLLVLNAQFRGVQKIDPMKKLVCFVIDGGWDNWDGETLRTKGLGGSETCIIRFAETIAKNYDEYNVIVFCKCKSTKDYKGVRYVPINQYVKTVSEYNIHVSLINRYTEIVPLAVVNECPVVLMLHDLNRENDIILPSPWLKHITCLSDWHSRYVTSRFPDVSNVISTMSYGLEVSEMPVKPKIPRSFIYSSFPTRGLYWLLKLFPKIVERYPDAHLNVFCNMEHKWCHDVAPGLMAECKRMLEEQKEHVTNHGWVNGSILKEYWATSHIWFYPTDFKETCCLTAWEAAASKTLAITSDLAALQESVADRGIVIPGDVSTNEWQEQALANVFAILDNPALGRSYIEKNYQWICAKNYDTVVDQFVCKYIR